MLLFDFQMKKEEKMEIEAFKVIGISVKTTNENSESMGAILELWETFMKEDIMSKIPNKSSMDIYSVYTDYEGDYMAPYTVILGCRVTSLGEVPEGMVGKCIPGGKSAVYKAKGNLNEGIVFKAWQEIWNADINRAYTTDYEVYGKKVKSPEDAEVDIFVALK